MKNTIPLIVAILLGGLAVFAVSKMIRPKDADAEGKYIEIVMARRPITPKDGPINREWLVKHQVEVASKPKTAIPWSEINRVVGQSMARTVVAGDFILTSDVQGYDSRLDYAIGDGEWAVPVTFSDPALVQILQPGMEIAILGTSVMQEIIAKKDASEAPDVVEHRATSVVFPCVRILDIGKGDAVRRNEEEGANGTIIVALTPRQASTLVAAQRTMELYPALRKTNDKNALKRRDVGIVTEATFKSLRENLEAVTLPETDTDK